MEPLRLRDEVAERSGLDALTATFAITSVLRALALELSSEDDERLRAALPEPWSDLLEPDPGATFHWGEFIHRVVRPDGSPDRPRQVAEAVLEVLSSHVDNTQARALLRLPKSFPSEARVAKVLAWLEGHVPGGSEADEEIALAVAQSGRGQWRRGSQPGEWEIEEPDRGRGLLRWIALDYEARVWRWNTGPTPAPALELTNGPSSFDTAEEAVSYVEANLLGI